VAGPSLACSPTGALWALRHFGRERACSGRGAGRSTGLVKGETETKVEIGRHTKCNTKPFPPPPSLPTLQAYIQTYLPTSPSSGLHNGPTYVALALWLNGPPCKWSGVEWSTLTQSAESHLSIFLNKAYWTDNSSKNLFSSFLYRKERELFTTWKCDLRHQSVQRRAVSELRMRVVKVRSHGDGWLTC